MSFCRPLYRSMGDIETLFLKEDINEINIVQPIYVTSLARSGTTIISQMLSELPETAYHRYTDFPEIHFPYWKNWLRKRKLKFKLASEERSHQDRLMVNIESIEAFEEVLWMTFFKTIHKDGFCQKIPLDTNSDFFKYYKDHIKKHLMVKNKTRYLSKANYNINRIELLLKHYPDAKFIVPIRHPINHLASLMKQQQLFSIQGNKKINKQLSASGHFEFGDIREIIVFDDHQAHSIKEHWTNGDEIQGWSNYWLSIYDSISKLKIQSKQLNDAIMFIKYEDLCFDTNNQIEQLMKHCELSTESIDQLKSKYNEILTPPDYYSLPFSPDEKSAIMKITKPISDLFQYELSNHL